MSLRLVETNSSEFAARIQPVLSRRLREMAHRFEEVGRAQCSLDQEQLDALTADVRDMASTARRMEDAAIKRVYVNEAVAPAVEAICQVEDAAHAARRLLVSRIGERVVDPKGEIVGELRKAVAGLKAAASLIAGSRAVQS